MVCKNRGIYGFMTAPWVVITMAPRDMVCAENLVGLGFLVVCFLHKTNPNPRKIICSVGKSGPTAILTV